MTGAVGRKATHRYQFRVLIKGRWEDVVVFARDKMTAIIWAQAAWGN